jgi:hypothetical protein
MRTTVTLDPDVAALVEAERARTGETFKQVVNRLLRRGAGGRGQRSASRDVPVHQGRPALDVVDVSAVLTALDDERGAGRDVP